MRTGGLERAMGSGLLLGGRREGVLGIVVEGVFVSLFQRWNQTPDPRWH